MIIPDSYAWTSPFQGTWIDRYFGRHFLNLYGKKIVDEATFKSLLLERKERPEIMLMGNFIVDRAAIVGLCREFGINVVHCEDGFFPHYQTVHADPLGFCWESSLPRMVFRECSNEQRARAQNARRQWLAKPSGELPAEIKKPFVLWPLQLIKDKVNKNDLRVQDWAGLIRHFRACLPPNFQLVIREHPRGTPEDVTAVHSVLSALPNTIALPSGPDLATLLRHSNAVAGANSSVLYEARLMHRKPTYTYARSWFTNHTELFIPMNRWSFHPIPRSDWLCEPILMQTSRLNDYTDWFLTQLLARQIKMRAASSQPLLFKQKLLSLSYLSYLKHGEAVFNST